MENIQRSSNGVLCQNIIGLKKIQKSGTQLSRRTSRVYFGEQIVFLRLTSAKENLKYENVFFFLAEFYCQNDLFS